MHPRRLFALAAALLCGVAALYFLRVERVVSNALSASRSSLPAASVPPTAAENQKSKSETPAAAADSNPLADQLNAPDGTLRRDLEVLNDLFVNFHTNFPGAGNPVGENAEITAALTGGNPLQFAFLPKNHRAINKAGELCDRWGTPFRFHQLSGTQMEIRSAGPDRKFGTPDDAEFAPWSKSP
jgi:hypothetical protein